MKWGVLAADFYWILCCGVFCFFKYKRVGSSEKVKGVQHDEVKHPKHITQLFCLFVHYFLKAVHCIGRLRYVPVHFTLLLGETAQKHPFVVYIQLRGPQKCQLFDVQPFLPYFLFFFGFLWYSLSTPPPFLLLDFIPAEEKKSWSRMVRYNSSLTMLKLCFGGPWLTRQLARDKTWSREQRRTNRKESKLGGETLFSTKSSFCDFLLSSWVNFLVWKSVSW